MAQSKVQWYLLVAIAISLLGAMTTITWQARTVISLNEATHLNHEQRLEVLEKKLHSIESDMDTVVSILRDLQSRRQTRPGRTQ